MSQCKLLVLGQSKAGKSGALVSLAESGRIIRYLDFDNNYSPLVQFSSHEAKKRIHRVACLDETISDLDFTSSGEIKIVTKVSVFQSWPTMIQALKEWPKDKSNPLEWGNESVLVIDSLSSMSKAAERGFLKMNGKSGTPLKWQEYRHVQEQIFEFLVHIGNILKCPIIVISHLQINGPDLNPADEIGTGRDAEELQKKILEKKLEGAEIIDYSLGPISTGKAKSQILPSVFSGCVYVEANEFGRKIYTTPKRGLQIGVPVPRLEASLPIETGLVKILDAWAPVKKESPKKETETEGKGE